MKHISVISFLFLFALPGAYAQKKPVLDDYSRQMDVYAQALKFNDLAAARNAVYQILSLRPYADNWIDTLSILYFSDGMYIQTILSGEKALKNNPSKINISEMMAVSYERLGAFKESLEIYQELIKQKDEIRFLYGILTLEFRLKRFEECLTTAEKILARPEAKTTSVRISISDQGYQDVSYAASVYNIMGIVFGELNLKEQAEQFFKKSMELAPEFVLPKNNLTKLQPDAK